MESDHWIAPPWMGPVESPALEFRVSFETDEACVVSLTGDIDCSNASTLAGVLESLSALGVLLVSIDGRTVRLVDGSGLHVLIAHARRFDERGGTITVVNPSAGVRRLLEVGNGQHLLERPHEER